MTEAYPLQWPTGRPRTPYPARSRFDTSQEKAQRTLIEEVRRMGGSNLVISTNIELRRDGLPYANRREPTDKGVAVYFKYKGREMCFACDRWDRIGDNIYAIAKTIEALRGIERWGSGSMVEQAFTGPGRSVLACSSSRTWQKSLDDMTAVPVQIPMSLVNCASGEGGATVGGGGTGGA